jgi:DNA repair exonuclease SbcCD ATPase subunit
MDLFDPPINFDLKTMPKDIPKLQEFENPYIQVVWEDTPENFTQERIKSVKQYFQKKYNSLNVNVISKTKQSEDVNQTIDVSFNIMDKNYQRELMKGFLETKGQGDSFEDILKIDEIVDNRIAAEDSEATPFQRWYIKKIHFSNFLSYGDNQVLDFEKCNGITVIESDPPNFGGKTVLTVDLLMFLFFNTTTKTQKAEEVFNRFRDSDKVSVRGEIIIDGDEYVVSRTITRKKAKSGEWNVKTELDFLKKLADGSYQNFTGEQRRETEKFIKNSIGEMDDFLMTILTTSTNLEELIDSKPTARGQVLSRFMGLEFLKRKELVAKEMLSEYSKSMISNVYNSETLKGEIETNLETIKQLQEDNVNVGKEITDVTERLAMGQEFRDDLLKSKHTDIDQDLITLNPIQLQSEITNAQSECDRLAEQVKSVVVKEPTDYYHEDKHDEIRKDISQRNIQKSQYQIQVEGIDKLAASVSGGIKCEHCGIELINAELTKARLAEKDELLLKIQQLEIDVKSLDEKDKSYAQLKKDFDEYEKNKLIKEKYELQLEASKLKLEKHQTTYKRYQESQDKIKKNQEIDAKIVKAQVRLDELINTKRELERKQTTNGHTITTLMEKNQSNQDKIEKIKEEFEKEKIYKIYLELFGKNGVSKIIMKTMMPVINQELQRLLQDSCYFNLEIRINEKNNEVEFMMIDNSTGIEKLMSSGSGYERTIASMALRSVLSKICSLPKPNIIVWDEVFGKISNDNLELVGEFFVKIKEYFEKIFVITHNPLVSNWADNIVKIKKVDNISSVHQ